MLQLKHNRLSIILVCFILGFMLALQFHSTQISLKASPQYQRTEELSQRLLQAEKERDALKKQIMDGTDAKSNSLNASVAIEAGTSAVEGPGVIVTVADSSKKAVSGENGNLYIVHDEDMLRIINELRAAGAEAISINGQRIVATTEIRCAGPTISVNNVRSAPPFEVRAIGDSETLENALKMRGGVIETLGVWGIKIDVDKKTSMIIPAYNRTDDFKYVQTAKDGDDK